MTIPDISVVIPIYNVEPFFAQCLNSLVNQTASNIEIICVNDGSTDNSFSIIKSFAEKYSQFVVLDKANGGYGAAVNAGFALAKGKYVGIVEPDDFVVSDMYESLFEMAKNTDWPDIVKAGYWEFYDDESQRLVEKYNIKLKNGSAFTVDDYPEALGGHPSVWSCIYRREFLTSNNIKMVEAKGAGWVDNPFFFETFCKAEKICWLKKPVYYYRQHAKASSNLRDCSIPIARTNEIFAFLERERNQNAGILFQLYVRALNYVIIIESNPYLTETDEQGIRNILKRMDKQLVAKTAVVHIGAYNRHCDKGEEIEIPLWKLFFAQMKQQLKRIDFCQKTYNKCRNMF